MSSDVQCWTKNNQDPARRPKTSLKLPMNRETPRLSPFSSPLRLSTSAVLPSREEFPSAGNVRIPAKTTATGQRAPAAHAKFVLVGRTTLQLEIDQSKPSQPRARSKGNHDKLDPGTLALRDPAARCPSTLAYLMMSILSDDCRYRATAACQSPAYVGKSTMHD